MRSRSEYRSAVPSAAEPVTNMAWGSTVATYAPATRRASASSRWLAGVGSPVLWSGNRVIMRLTG